MPYQLVNKQTLYTGKKVKLELHQLEDEDGKRHQREIVAHRGAVVILPLLRGGDILLVRQHRYAIGQALLELPAGTLEPNEDPMNCAGRELLEETGYLATRLRPIGSFFSSPGVLTEKMYAYSAHDLEKGEAQPDEGEEIELTPMSFDDALERIRGGLIADAKTIAALLMYDRFHRAR